MGEGVAVGVCVGVNVAVEVGVAVAVGVGVGVDDRGAAWTRMNVDSAGVLVIARARAAACSSPVSAVVGEVTSNEKYCWLLPGIFTEPDGVRLDAVHPEPVTEIPALNTVTGEEVF